jgi:hypothetical protein
MSIRFIDAWHKAVNLMSMFNPARVNPVYRGATPHRRENRGAGAWRNTNPGVSPSWGKKGIRQHKQVMARLKDERRQAAINQQLGHQWGCTAENAGFVRALKAHRYGGTR